MADSRQSTPPPQPVFKSKGAPPPPSSTPVKSADLVVGVGRESCMFNTKQLAEFFEMSVTAVTKRIKGVTPDGKIGRFMVWDISRVAILTNDAHTSIQQTYDLSKRNDRSLGDISADEPLPTSDLGSMTPNELKTYFQTVDIQQSYLKKKIANEETAGELLRKSDVLDSMVNSFKIISNYLDSLPDVLERDGLISSADMDKTINSVDRVRVELANSLDEFLEG